MSYPFVGSAPLAGVVKKLISDYGCERKVAATIFTRRGPIQSEYLVRVDENGKRWVAPLPDPEPTLEAVGSVTRSLLAQLGLSHVHPSDVGALGAWDPGDDDE